MRTTKFELQQQINTLTTEHSALRATSSVLRMRAGEAKHAGFVEGSRRAAMLAAKAEAQRTGRPVLVAA